MSTDQPEGDELAYPLQPGDRVAWVVIWGQRQDRITIMQGVPWDAAVREAVKLGGTVHEAVLSGPHCARCERGRVDVALPLRKKTT